MTRNDLDVALITRLCQSPLGGPPNAEAMDFLANYWAPFCHQVDDIIDGARTLPEEIISSFALAVGLCSHPFYVRHLPKLQPIVLLVASTYADSVAWERSETDWQRTWADHHRHCSLDMVFAVALICGGYQHARSLMKHLRTMSWQDHHDADGKPI